MNYDRDAFSKCLLDLLIIIHYCIFYQETVNILNTEPNKNENLVKDARLEGSSEDKYVDSLIDGQGNNTE